MDHRQTTRLLPQILTTRDHRLVELRPMEPGDEPLLDRFFASLSPAARRMRFHGGVRTVSRQVLQRMVRWDPQRELALLALAGSDVDPVCIGEARYALGDGRADQREFALAVDDDWQGLGIGTAMLDQLTRHAEAAGVARLVGDVMPENSPMIGLARRLGYSLRNHPEDPRLQMLTRTLVEPREATPPWATVAALPGALAFAR